MNKKNHISWIGIWKTTRICMIMFAGWFVSFALVASMLMYGAQPIKIDDPEYLMILGASLDGDQPGLTLQQRLQVGLAYLEENPDVDVIVTGGQGADEAITEAKAMAAFLKQNGIQSNRIILEENSHSTMENFKFSADILKQRGKEQPIKIVFVTSNFHLPRATMLAERNGFISGRIPAPTPINVLPVSLFREYFALVKSFVLDK